MGKKCKMLLRSGKPEKCPLGAERKLRIFLSTFCRKIPKYLLLEKPISQEKTRKHPESSCKLHIHHSPVSWCKAASFPTLWLIDLQRRAQMSHSSIFLIAFQLLKGKAWVWPVHVKHQLSRMFPPLDVENKQQKSKTGILYPAGGIIVSVCLVLASSMGRWYY